jgi:hypothetical protein
MDVGEEYIARETRGLNKLHVRLEAIYIYIACAE